MIQALKSEPSTSAAVPAAASKDGRSAESFDPMLALMVAQMLGSYQPVAPQAAAPSASPVSKTADPPASKVEAAGEASHARFANAASARSTEQAERGTSTAGTEQSAKAAEKSDAPPASAEPGTEASVEKAAPQAETSNASVRDDGPVALEAETTAAADTSTSAPPRLQQVVERDPEGMPHPQVTQAPLVVTERATPQASGPHPLESSAGGASVATETPQAVPQVAATSPGEHRSQGLDIRPPGSGAAPAETPGASASTVASTPVPVPQEGAPAETRATPALSVPALASKALSETVSEAVKGQEAVAKATASTSSLAPVQVLSAATLAPVPAKESAPAAPGLKADTRVQAVGTLQPPGTASAVARVQTTSSAAASAPPAKAAPHPALAQVDGTIRWILRRQEQSADLQLHPESLGKVQIKLTMEGQQVHAQVWASEASTVPILREHLAFLEVSLQEQGLSLGTFQLQQGDRSDAGSAQSQGRASQATPGVAPTESLQEVPVAVNAPVLGAYRIHVLA